MKYCFWVLFWLSGCSSVSHWLGGSDNGPEPTELKPIQALIEPQIIWQVKIGAGPSNRQLIPAIGQAIYVADGQGHVQARSIEEGHLIWQTDLNVPLSGGPSLLDNHLVLTGTEGQVFMLDEQGELIWQRDLQGEILARAALDAGIVVVHTVDGRIIALDAYTGNDLWLYHQDTPLLTLRGSAAPLIHEGLVYCGLANGKLVALNLDDGSVEWQTYVVVPQGQSDLERMVDVDTDPVIYDQAVFVAAYQGAVAAFGANTGHLFWKNKQSVYRTLAVDWQQVVAVDEHSFLFSFDPDLGELRWQQDQLAYRDLSAPAIFKNYVVVGDFAGYLHWLSSEDGQIVARQKLGHRIDVPPVVMDERLYIYSQDGTLTAIQLEEP